LTQAPSKLLEPLPEQLPEQAMWLMEHWFVSQARLSMRQG
jgi:hypothetical protein